MYYVYVLQSKKNGKMYIGCTGNLKQRFLLHNSGNIYSTRRHRPLKLIYYEAFINRHDAFTREQWLKTGWGRNQLQKILSNYLASQNFKEI